MPTFAYSGRTRAGQNVTGERAADTVDAAVAALRRDQILVTRINPVKQRAAKKVVGAGRGKSVPAKNLAVFTRHFSAVIDATRGEVESGMSLADAMKKHPKAFDPLFTNMIAAGEAGGILDTILKRLATYIAKNVKLQGQVKPAMVYPIAVIVIAGVIVGIILWKVIPTFAAMFASLGAELPLPTRVVIAASTFLARYWWAFALVIAALAYGFRRYYATHSG